MKPSLTLTQTYQADRAHLLKALAEQARELDLFLTHLERGAEQGVVDGALQGGEPRLTPMEEGFCLELKYRVRYHYGCEDVTTEEARQRTLTLRPDGEGRILIESPQPPEERSTLEEF